MKKIFGIVCLCLLLAGCTQEWRDARNGMKCMQSVMEDIGTDDVKTICDSKYRFIARDTAGNIWYYETLSDHSPEVTAKVKIFSYK